MNSRLLTIALTAGLMVGCMSNSEEEYGNSAALKESKSNAVSFITYLQGAGNGNTRAGATGVIDDAKLKTSGYGFGVFGYYTGTTDYAQNTVANFMYNQKVEWKQANADAGYATGWTYEPVKYWPNDIQNGAVDDQNNDSGNDPATGDGTNGGKVSFFAYSPYVQLSTSSDIETSNGGIIAINNNKRVAGNSLSQNPKITYEVPSEGANTVDLLWGTRNATNTNVLGLDNTGKSYNAGGTAYEQAILSGYNLNADLTKQKTNGTVSFLFKHALSKVGGSTNPSSPTTKNGLMVVLDIDDLLGDETGGELESYAGTVTEQTKYNTKVTVSDVTIVGRTLMENGGKKPGDVGYTVMYLAQNKGVFDLATGKWNITGTQTTSQPSAAITTYTITGSSTTTGVLASGILEPDSKPATTQAGFESLPLGVQTTPQNVYGTEANPLVFIPGTYPELTISITYTVRTYDPNLSLAYSEVTQRITKKLTFTEAVKLNKQYSILMHLGLSSFKFTATVSEWERHVTAVGEDGLLVEEEAVEHIYLPRNVGEPPVGTEATTITIDGRNYAIVIKQDGVEDGQTYFATTKPLYVTVYDVTDPTNRQKVILGDGKGDGGTNNGIYFLCHGSTNHFHRGGEISYNDDSSSPDYGVATMTTNPSDHNIRHDPIDVSLTINGKKQSVSTTIHIWPENYLPY